MFANNALPGSCVDVSIGEARLRVRCSARWFRIDVGDWQSYRVLSLVDNSEKGKAMKQTFLIACVALALAPTPSQPLAAQSTTSPSLTGSWQLTLIASTPPLSAPAVVPIPALATFTEDGSVVETGATEVVAMTTSSGAPVYATPGHGIWQPGPVFGRLFIQFINLLVNPNETLHAKKTVTITGALNSTGNQFNGNYSFQLVDPSGHVIAKGSGTVTGERIPHPLLP